MPTKLVLPLLFTMTTIASVAGCNSPKANSGHDPSHAPISNPGKAEKVVLAIPSETGTEEKIEHYAIAVPGGSTVEVTLPFQAGTGYSWALASHSDGLALVNTSTRSLTNDGRTGGPMEAIYVLKRSASGSTPDTAVFKLSRPWENDAPPAREVKATFTEAGAKG